MEIETPNAAVNSARSAMRSNNYKQLKEAFVSNLNGGSIWEINAVTFVLPAAVIAWSALQSRKQFFTPYTPAALVADWLINCGSILSILTVYSGNPVLLNALLLLPALISLITSSQHPSNAAKRKPPQTAATDGSGSSSKQIPFPLKPFVTMYRGSMMVVTCAGILAVDFRVFPRRFAKVENWGTSLMDLGVGSFVFSAGVVSARSILKEQFSGRRTSLFPRYLNSLRSSLALLALGMIRLLSVKGVDYAEHVTEYGVHWNFFFTLGFLPPFLAVFQSLFGLVPSYPALALIVGVVYEAALDFTNLTTYIVSAPRHNLISMNREGICSFAGYLAIFLAGQGAGMHVLPREPPKETGKPTSSSEGNGVLVKVFRLRQTIAGKLAMTALGYTLLYLITTSYQGFNLRVSRRLANLPYVLWISAFNNIQIMIVMLTEKFLFPNIYVASTAAATAGAVEEEKKRCSNATSRVLHAFNRNGLPIFLLANLLTGAVNLSMKTIQMGTMSSMAVLTGYMAILGGVAVGLDLFDISIKL